jgi:hypothetical protein
VGTGAPARPAREGYAAACGEGSKTSWPRARATAARRGASTGGRDRETVLTLPTAERFSHQVSLGPLRAPGSLQNRTCEFPRIRLKPFRRPLLPDPAGAMLLLDLRDTRLQPPYPLPEAESAPGVLRLPSSAFSLSGGSSNSLATKDPSDVGSLSRPVMLQPVSAPLQRGLRFFRHLKPAHRSTRLTARPLASAEALTGDVRGFHVPLMKHV